MKLKSLIIVQYSEIVPQYLFMSDIPNDNFLILWKNFCSNI